MGLCIVAMVLTACSSAYQTSPAETASSPVAGTAKNIALPADEVFLNALAGRVTSVGSAVAEGMGHRVCSAFAESVTVAEIRSVIQEKGLRPSEASRIVLAAVTAYCPEYGEKSLG
jgi:hypothetical protein